MKDLNTFNAELKQKNLAGYWETSEGEVYREPAATYEPCVWKWKDVEDAIVQAGEVVGLEMVSRRVIRLCSPGKGTTAHTFQFNLQMLRPGETTRAHRHTSSAIYHVFRGRGATVIDDVRHEWECGDSFSVPPWRFHYHENASKEPAILFTMNNKPVLSALGYYREETATK